jgi:hypothetical protein
VIERNFDWLARLAVRRGGARAVHLAICLVVSGGWQLVRFAFGRESASAI